LRNKAAPHGDLRAGQKHPAHTRFSDLTSEEQKEVNRYLHRRRLPPARSGRFRKLVSGATKAIQTLTLGLGLATGYLDGDDLDNVGLTVAQQPARSHHRARSTESGQRRGTKRRQRAGECGGDPHHRANHAQHECRPALRPVRRSPSEGGRPGAGEAGRCAHHMPGGMCRRYRTRCPLLPTQKRVEKNIQKQQPRYELRKGLRGWHLVFNGDETVLPDSKAVTYAITLLKDPPPEPLHASELAHRAFGDAIIAGQRNLAMDDRERADTMLASRRRCLATIDDPNSNPIEREEARAELDAIDDWARKHMRGTEGNEQRQVRAIRQSLRRLLADLATSPDPILQSFGQHLELFLWRPSTRAVHSHSSRLHSGLAGRFTYEPPAGVKWKS